MSARNPMEIFPHSRAGFTFGNVDSKEFGIILQDVKSFGTPERDITYLEVPGRSGDLMLDNNRWKNLTVTYRCLIVSDFVEQFQRMQEAFLPLKGYQVLTDTVRPEQFRMATLSASIEPTVKQKGKSGNFDLTFQCKPQRYFFYGQQPQIFRTPGRIYNPYPYASKPVITLYGDGPGILTVGTRTVEVLELADSITLDCDTMNAYRKTGQGAPENKNNAIRAVEFPELGPGSTVIQWTGGIESAKIVPRWWTL